MPTLKQLTCSLELGPSGTSLKEYSTRITDGGIEAFVAVPEVDLPFNIHVTSSGYIAPGLAVYVWCDGEYQCNRHRQHMPLPAPGMNPREYEVDFKMRQKEEKTSQGHFIGRDWTFAKLKTANADSVPNNSPNFAKNVGTIEVVVLRCRHDPMELRSSDLGSHIAPSMPFTVSTNKFDRMTVPMHKPTAEMRPASKQPSKAATQISSKKASAAGEDMMGGMFGLFDGAGDEPDIPYRVSRRFVDQTPIPGYRWDTRTGTYRYHQSDDPFVDRRNNHALYERLRAPYQGNLHEQRAFTVHGGRTINHRQPPSRPPIRPTTANERHELPFSPPQGFPDFQRHRKPPRDLSVDVPRLSPRSRIRDPEPAPPEGVSFVLSMGKQIEQIYLMLCKARNKADSLCHDCETYRRDPNLYLAAVKALRAQEHEIQGFNVEIDALLAAIFSRMRRMDRDAWYYTRDYLVGDLRLVNPELPELREWLDPRLRSYDQPRVQESETLPGRHDDEWQEVGQGEAEIPLWQIKQQEQIKRQKEQEKPTNEVGNDKCGNDAPIDAIDQILKTSNDLAPETQNNNQGIDRRVKDDGEEKQSSEPRGQSKDQGVANDNTRGKRSATESDKPQGDWAARQNGGDQWQQRPWNNSNANDNYQHNNSDLRKGDMTETNRNDRSNGKADRSDGGVGQDMRSRSHSSRVNNWNDGGKDHVHGRISCAGGASASRLEPVIKPYWADFGKPAVSSSRPRAGARDVYQYPALPRPARTSGKATDVSYGVAAGRGANYAHRMLRPNLLDTMEKPYAIFTFKYRSKSALERILNRKIDTAEVRRAAEEVEKQKLLRLPKDKLVQQMLRMKLADSSNKPPSAKSASNTRDMPAKAPTNQWLGDQAWEAADDGTNNNFGSGWGGDGDVGRAASGTNSNRKNGGDGGKAWEEDKTSSTAQHFGGDQNLQNTQGNAQEQQDRANTTW